MDRLFCYFISFLFYSFLFLFPQTPSGCDYLTITPDRSLVFPSVEYVRAVISKHGTRQGTAVPVVIDSTHIQAADFTAAKVTIHFINFFFFLSFYIFFCFLFFFKDKIKSKRNNKRNDHFCRASKVLLRILTNEDSR